MSVVGERLPAERRLPEHLRRILVVDAGPLEPDSNAGERSTADLLSALVSLGADVHFLPLGSKGARDRQLLEGLEASGVRAHAPRPSALPDALHDGTVDVAIVNRPGPAAMALPALLGHPEVLRIFWGSDIHARRLAAQEAVHGRPAGSSHRVTALAERHCWQSYDVTVYPTEREASLVDEALGHPHPARAASCPYYALAGDDLLTRPPERAGRSGVLMVGGAAHGPNRDAVEWTAHEILPLLRAALPGLEVTVVGAWPQDTVNALTRPGLRFAGQVTDHELRDLHHRSLCLLAPLRFGSGARRKIVAAMGLGVPVVTTSEGQEGLLVRDGRGESDGLTIGDTAEELAAGVSRLHVNGHDWDHRVRRALAAVSATYSRDRFEDAVRDVIVATAESCERPRIRRI